MPPKARLWPAAAPAAVAKAKAKGKAKAAPKARGRVRAPVLRGRGRVRIRPAAQASDPVKDFENCKEVESHQISALTLLSCGKVVLPKSSYWREDTEVAGVFLNLKVTDGEIWLNMRVDGTRNDHLLRFLSGQKDRVIKVHLCPPTCGQEFVSDSTLHMTKVRKIKEGEEEGWMSNLVAVERGPDEDELRELRREATGVPTEEEDQGSEGKKKSKKKKEKSKKEEKKKDKEKKRKRSRSPAKKKGARDLEVVLGGSGLDPDPRQRSHMMRKARRLVKKKKKKKEDSSDSGSGKKTGSSSSDTSLVMEPGEVFGQTRMAKRIWLRCPGVLAATSLSSIQEQLLTSQGQLWDINTEEPPPIFMQFFRGHLGARMDGSCHEDRSTSRGLLPRSGVTRPDSRASGCPGSTPESPRRADGWEALDSDIAVRVGARGESFSGISPRNRTSCEGGERSRKAESPSCESIRIQPSRGQKRGLEKRRWKGKIFKGRRQTERLERRLQRRQQGVPERKGRRQEQGQGSERKVTEDSKEGAKTGAKIRERYKGGEEPPEDGARGREARVETPKRGVEVGAKDASRGMATGAPPAQVASNFSVEGGKYGPTREYLPTAPSGGIVGEDHHIFSSLEGQGMGAVGNLLMSLMDLGQFDLLVHGKPQSSGSGTNDLFPLPWSTDILDECTHPALARATCRALNLLYGVVDGGKKKAVCAATERALKFIMKCVDSFSGWDVRFENFGFDIFFRSKGVDYRGEEVRVAQRFSWSSISPALPPEVGGVQLVDFCSLGTKYYVEHFKEYLVPPEKQWLGRSPSVMALDEDWFDICQGLIDSRVCGVIPLEEVWHINGRPMLGGLFGVGKGEFNNNVETQRLIMNFIPLNQNCRPLDSDIATLPGISGLSPFLMEDGEMALISSEDIRCFFYLFALPPNGFLSWLSTSRCRRRWYHWNGKGRSVCFMRAFYPWVSKTRWE